MTERMDTMTQLHSKLAKLFLLAAILAGHVQAEPKVPAGCCRQLEAAANHLADRDCERAADGFQGVAKDSSAPAFARALAMLGLVETALDRRDTQGARVALRRLAADADLPRFYRELAGQYLAKGRSGHDERAHRVELPTLPEPAVVLHVASAGDDAGDGSKAHPFRTLVQARDAVRAMKESHGGTLPQGGVRIMIHGGTYAVTRTLELTAKDGGTALAPVVYQARSGKAPVLSGGVRISKWKRISDAELRERLEPSVRDRVLEADLKTFGIREYGDPVALRERPELFVNGEPQTLARWPNEGFVRTGEILGEDRFQVWGRIDGCRDGKFRYVEERPGRWLDEPDVRLYGYWFWDWFEEYQKVAAIDPDARTFTLSRPYSNYGYREGQRYYAVNVFRELDHPGEWYLDRRSGMIYWLPPERIDPTEAETVLSVFDKPFVKLDGAEHVMLLGLTLEEGRSNGIEIRGGTDCLVAGCTIRRFGGDAIVVDGGQRHGVFGCTMHTLGCGGARVTGGDRKTLTPGRHFVENCTVSDISRLKRTYTPAVRLDGCGNRIAHNLFEDMPSSAMRIEGNDQLIELNLIRNVVQESDDQGGLDMWGNPLYRGVVIRWNRWSDIRGGTHTGAAGVRLDDMISGVVVHGNIFERCGSARFGGVQIHGGKENLIDNNLFVDCLAGISFSRWSEKRWLESIARFLPRADDATYLDRYPELARIKEDANVNIVARNLFARCEDVFLRDGGVQRTALNDVSETALDPTVASRGGSLCENPRLKRLLFQPIPVGDIGPYAHAWRAE